MIASLLLGTLGPLVVAAVSWIVMSRTFRRDRTQLTSAMTLAFAAKMIFFAVYVSLAMAVLKVEPAPFASSLTVSFVAFYAIEAVYLRRMLNS